MRLIMKNQPFHNVDEVSGEENPNLPGAGVDPDPLNQDIAVEANFPEDEGEWWGDEDLQPLLNAALPLPPLPPPPTPPPFYEDEDDEEEQINEEPLENNPEAPQDQDVVVEANLPEEDVAEIDDDNNDDAEGNNEWWGENQEPPQDAQEVAAPAQNQFADEDVEEEQIRENWFENGNGANQENVINIDDDEEENNDEWWGEMQDQPEDAQDVAIPQQNQFVGEDVEEEQIRENWFENGNGANLEDMEDNDDDDEEGDDEWWGDDPMQGAQGVALPQQNRFAGEDVEEEQIRENWFENGNRFNLEDGVDSDEDVDENEWWGDDQEPFQGAQGVVVPQQNRFAGEDVEEEEQIRENWDENGNGQNQNVGAANNQNNNNDNDLWLGDGLQPPQDAQAADVPQQNHFAGEDAEEEQDPEPFNPNWWENANGPVDDHPYQRL